MRFVSDSWVFILHCHYVCMQVICREQQKMMDYADENDADENVADENVLPHTDSDAEQKAQ